MLMGIPEEIRLILADRESGSLLLLNRLIVALEKEVHLSDQNAGEFRHMVLAIRKKLNHFAAIENFLASLIKLTRQNDPYPGKILRFLTDYSLYWQDSDARIANNFLRQNNPEGKTILTHSHSQTVISLLGQLHKKQINFRVLQTLSAPGEEGRISQERMHQMQIQADLTDDVRIKEALRDTDLVLMGCDALLPMEFFNKTGTRSILEEAKHFNIPCYLVAESRKEITHSDWKKPKDHPLFEWVALDLIDKIVSER